MRGNLGASQPTSIIVPWATKDNHRSPLLGSLAQYLGNPANLEIIIVHDSDSPKPSIPTKLQPLATCVAFERCGRWTNAHPAGAKRNFGASHAKGKRLIFLDSDCRVEERCVARHRIQDQDDFVLCGAIDELPYEQLQSIDNRLFDRKRTKIEQDHRRRDFDSHSISRIEFNMCYSGNFSVGP